MELIPCRPLSRELSAFRMEMDDLFGRLFGEFPLIGKRGEEKYYGSFQRSFELPTGVKPDKIEATFDKGVLKVTLPKKEEDKKKEI